MMDRFHRIEEGEVILLRKGVYRQAPIYRRGDGVYAKWGGGFVRLHAKGGTSIPDLSWRQVDGGAFDVFETAVHVGWREVLTLGHEAEAVAVAPKRVAAA